MKKIIEVFVTLILLLVFVNLTIYTVDNIGNRFFKKRVLDASIEHYEESLDLLQKLIDVQMN